MTVLVMKKSENRLRSMRWQARTVNDFHTGQDYSVRWPWAISGTNPTPYWASPALSALGLSTVATATTQTKIAFGVWFKTLGVWTQTLPIFDITWASSSAIEAVLSAADTITFSYAEHILPYWSGGTTINTMQFPAPYNLDDGNWHFVGFAKKGGSASTSCREATLIVDNWSYDLIGSQDALMAIGGNHTLELGKGIGSHYAQYMELAEPSLYWADPDGAVILENADNLKFHYQFGPIMAGTTDDPFSVSPTYQYVDYLIAQWTNAPVTSMPSGVWKSTATNMDMTWQGASGLETLVKDNWYRDAIIGNLFQDKIETAQIPKSQGGDIGHSIGFTVVAGPMSWINNVITSLPNKYSYIISTGTALDIPAGQKPPITDNTSFLRTTKLLKRHTGP